MNKIFIIGNGFDLAHGLPTSYNHFIDDFWKKITINYEEEYIKKIVYVDEINSGFLKYNSINSFDNIVANIEEHCKEYGYFYDKINHQYYTDRSRSHPIFKFQNDFFGKLNTHKTVYNWVDVENLYYYELKKIVKSQKLNLDRSDEDFLIDKKKLVKKLNSEFDQIKDLFIKYIKDEVIDKYDFSDNLGSRYWKEYYDILMPFSISLDDKSKIFFEFTDDKDVQELKNLYEDQKEGGFFNQSYFLCFNYTPTAQTYFSIMRDEKIEVKLNYIHNSILSESDSIIFGFGDEMDDDYKLIENIDDNEYLKNFKSFQYSQNSSYNYLLAFINSNRYQICVLGHSCGLSDRVLLNTLFEHKNCRSIKVFYHESYKKDNYTDIIQNISRHFTDKQLMRERVVNKTLSSPMKQVQVPMINKE